MSRMPSDRSRDPCPIAGQSACSIGCGPGARRTDEPTASEPRLGDAGRPRLLAPARGPRADRSHGRRGLPPRASSQPLCGLLGRVRVASRIPARRRPEVSELEALRAERQALRQAVRRRDQSRLPPRDRRQRLHGDRQRRPEQAEVCHDAGRGAGPPGPEAARRRRRDPVRGSRPHAREAAGPIGPARRDPGRARAPPRARRAAPAPRSFTRSPS